MVLVVTLGACGPSVGEVSPTTVSQIGGVELLLRTPVAIGEGGVVVLVDKVPASAVVVEAPRLVRARLPSLPRAGVVDVELLSAEGSLVTVAQLEVTAPVLDVRARE